MDPQLQHDPRTKQQVKDILYKFLYTPAKEKYERRLKEIIIKNCQLIGNANESFIYRGITYCVNDDVRLPRRMNRLDSALHQEMDKYIADTKQLNEHELPYVLGFINQVLNSSNDLQDYLKILPESVHKPIQALIDTCGCRMPKLAPETVLEIQTKNQIPIQLMKERLVQNLLM